jgi:Tetratrico peptide repeat
MLRSAAGRAVARGAPAAAVPLLRRALEEPLDPAARTSTLLELGHAERRADRHSDAIAHLREAARLAADPLTRCDAVISLALSVGPVPEHNRELIPIVTAALDDSARLDRERWLMLQTALLSALYNSWSSETWSSEDPLTAEIGCPSSRSSGGDTRPRPVLHTELPFRLHHRRSSCLLGQT